MFGTTELVLILAILVLLFGASKIPDLASGLGKGIRSFKKAMNEPDAIDVTPESKDASELEGTTASEDEAS